MAFRLRRFLPPAIVLIIFKFLIRQVKDLLVCDCRDASYPAYDCKTALNTEVKEKKEMITIYIKDKTKENAKEVENCTPLLVKYRKYVDSRLSHFVHCVYQSVSDKLDQTTNPDLIRLLSPSLSFLAQHRVTRIFSPIHSTKELRNILKEKDNHYVFAKSDDD